MRRVALQYSYRQLQDRHTGQPILPSGRCQPATRAPLRAAVRRNSSKKRMQLDMSRPVPPSRARQRILELIKQQGPQDAQSLASQLRVSTMAVRQHLYALQSSKLVEYVEQTRRIGRPAKVWKLTTAADVFFPDAHAALAVDLVESLIAAVGQEGMERVVKARARRQIEGYRETIPQRASLRRRLQKLAALRTREGYMAEVEPRADGSFLLVENHCPICAAASACTGLCAAELEVFQQVLGPDVAVERHEHILEGQRRCAYEVRASTRCVQP